MRANASHRACRAVRTIQNDCAGAAFATPVFLRSPHRLGGGASQRGAGRGLAAARAWRTAAMEGRGALRWVRAAASRALPTPRRPACDCPGAGSGCRPRHAPCGRPPGAGRPSGPPARRMRKTVATGTASPPADRCMLARGGRCGASDFPWGAGMPCRMACHALARGTSMPYHMACMPWHVASSGLEGASGGPPACFGGGCLCIMPHDRAYICLLMWHTCSIMWHKHALSRGMHALAYGKTIGCSLFG